MKNLSTVLSLALMTALSFGVTGCGSDDAKDVADALVGGDGSIYDGSVNGDSGIYGNVSYTVLVNNINKVAADSFIAQSKEYYTGFTSRYVDNTGTCKDLGFSAADIDYSDAGSSYYPATAEYSKYTNGTYSGCEEEDWSKVTDSSGSYHVIVGYNYY